MARGSANQPSDKHWKKGTECEIVFYEQDSHRDVSKGNGRGFFAGAIGEYWQSHHILCISAMGCRQASTPDATQKMEKALYITKWNINEAPNMLGMPMKLQYIEAYGDVEQLPAKAQNAAWGAVQPKDIPAHNVDHNTKGGYTSEVKDHLQANVWNKFKPQGGDHATDAKWLANELTEASKEFERILLDERGIRKAGTVAAWKDRFNDVDWCEPFSMADPANQRKPGTPAKPLSDIFARL
jgi:hypothetical protein